jgi:hypothetical protein
MKSEVGMVKSENDESSGRDESRALLVLENIDSDLIVQELEGRAVRQWAYRFREGGDDGAEVTGLTVAGVEQCSRESARHGEALRIIRRDWYPMDAGADGTPNAWFAVVEVGRFAVRETGEEILLDTSLGTKQELLRKYSARKRRWYENPHALDVAISKAVRNAKKKLLDPELQQRVLAAALDTGQVLESSAERRLQAETEAAHESLPAPDRAQVAEAQARATFYATAGVLGLKKQEDIHARLRSTIGLVCPAGAVHDGYRRTVRPDDDGACHALRAAVERYAATTGPSKAAGWEALTEQLDLTTAPEIEVYE